MADKKEKTLLRLFSCLHRTMDGEGYSRLKGADFEKKFSFEDKRRVQSEKLSTGWKI